MKRLFLATVLAVASIGVASAHTTSLGYVPGANAGEVTFWLAITVMGIWLVTKI